MSVRISFVFILLSVLGVFSTKLARFGDDQMCKPKGGLLCMKDELMIIATITNGIARTSNEIEKHIKQTKVLETLNRYVNTEVNLTASNTPTAQSHTNFFALNNIDKEQLSEIFLEAHNAMLYYYNTIDNLLNLQGVFAQTTDEWFRKIQYNIRDEIICRYRSILYVYSEKWKLITEIDRMRFSKKPRLSPSLTHDVHSIVIARSLRKWMELIHSVISNLEMKLL